MSRLLILFALLPAPLYAEPTTIIHILNYHYVTPEVFAADLKDQDSTITQEQIDKQYFEFLKRGGSLQKEQVKLLRRLIKRRKLKSVYIEGLTEKNYKGTMRFIETLKNYEKYKTPPESSFDKLVAAQNRLDLLELGAAGQLVVNGELETLLPAEDLEAMEAANPVRDDGKIVFDKEADERREDAIVRNLLKGSGVVVIVLGEDHDLRDNLKRLGPGVKYIRLKVMLGHKELKKMKAIHKQFLVLQEKKAGDTEWARFEKKVHTEIDSDIRNLEAFSSSDYPHLQHLLWASRDYLYPMLKDARTEKNRDQDKFEKHLKAAERIINNQVRRTGP
ncbi:hypothetical protein [Gimesia aquarii]|uniref:Uncharacterized protein n=1 Tax=Gimesia aquarii TaxID=2527964 RepID=A0A517VRR8_9PLAN|nr:hypothetical protein [Gimesia aquarii]QDT95639.1 hypothetical protein V144x_10850 [Gimesia aquarii]